MKIDVSNLTPREVFSLFEGVELEIENRGGKVILSL
jgi:hypothetical protein